MNIVFFGSAQFAVASLKALLDSGHTVFSVVTQPDRKKGRGLHIEGIPVKACALRAGLQVYQPAKVNASESVEYLKKLNPDLFVVVAYGQILSKEILSIPKIFAINAHASILPKYRGASPINFALINGEESTGVTIIKMAEKMDAGPIILSKKIDITSDDTFVSLEEKLSLLAASLVVESIKLIETDDFRLTEQNEAQASFAPKIKKEDGLIDWKKPAEEIYNFIRGILIWPGAFTYYNGKLIKIFKAQIVKSQDSKSFGEPGRILNFSKDGIVVETSKGNLIIEELQVEGKKKMKAEEFISGHKIKTGEKLVA